MPVVLCPDCRGSLAISTEGPTFCTVCGYRPPATMGILDLREPGSAARDTEAGVVQQLLQHFDQASYGELLEIRLREAPSFVHCIGHEKGYLAIQGERSQAMIAMFRGRLREAFGVEMPRGAALDVGCGSGGGLPALARDHEVVFGVDPSLPDLLLAAKLLQSEQIRNVRLVQAYGQSLPFPDCSFDYVNAVNVLEHVFALEATLADVRRVLRTGGCFAADSRNRFDLFLPEPHVKLRWVGFLPRRLAKRYVSWRRGVPYEITRLLSYGELRRGLQHSFGRRSRVTFPGVIAYGGSRRADTWLRRLERAPLARDIALWFFPSHLVLAQRVEEAAGLARLESGGRR